MNKKSNFEAAQERFRALGLDELWAELFRPGSPLAFLSAQGLRVAQPMLGAFTDSSGLAALSAWADRLEAPEDEETN